MDTPRQNSPVVEDSRVMQYADGFSPSIFLDLDDDTASQHTCHFCKKIFRHPQQRKCGHSFCKVCLEKMKNQTINSGAPVHCPECESIDDLIEDSTISVDEENADDFAKMRKLWKKNVKCPHSGCPYTGLLRDYQATHEASCEFALVPCPNNCGENIHITQIKLHLDHHCLKRRVVCPYCNEEYTMENEKDHHDICPDRPSICDLCNKKGLTRQQLINHKENDCPYFECKLGCNNKKMARSKIDSHYRDLHFAKEHMVFIGRQLNEISMKIKELITSAKKLKHSAGARAEDRRVSDLIIQFDNMRDQVKELDNLCSVFKVEFEKVFDSSNFNKQRTDQIAQRLSEMQNRLQRLEQAVQIRDVQLLERDLRLKALEEVSCDGTLIWRIENFSECRRKAQNGEMTSIYSPAFYTSRCGYKMCARLYLNGDGIGKGTHVSFFFVMMKGKYDGLLRWPFQQKVTMMLMDYTGQYHIMDAFRPDSGSASFYKPKNEMNVASGCPLFMPLTSLDEKIKNHVRDDVAYFKIIVDCSDIPY